MWPGAAVQGPQVGAQKLWVGKAMEQVQQARVLGRQGKLPQAGFPKQSELGWGAWLGCCLPSRTELLRGLEFTLWVST